jgi:hypothetical protein
MFGVGFMFEIGRELMRFFSPSRPRDGLCLGDVSLLELLDLNLLRAEARSADVAAGRTGITGRAQRLIEASAVHRELARRTGDAAALRKAASCAERAVETLKREGRKTILVQALCARAQVALTGADLFGENGLNAAAGFLAGQSPAADDAAVIRARLAARRAIGAGELRDVEAAASGLLAAAAASRPGEPAGARLCADRAELLMSGGDRLREPRLIEEALAALDAAIRRVDGAFHPLTLARLKELRGQCLLKLADVSGDVALILDGVDTFAEAIELIGPGHSPLDWARLHHGMGLAYMALGEAGPSAAGFDRALQAFSKALIVTQSVPGVALRTMVVQDRAAGLVRRAEILGDVYALDEAEAVLRGELAVLKPSADPAPWAVLQLNLARIYLEQAALRGLDQGEGSRAGEALSAALDVFAELGMRSLAVEAEAQLERLRNGRANVR